MVQRQTADETQARLEAARTLLRDADRLVVGVGAGLSAAAGLDYADPRLAARWFPEYLALGARTLQEIQAHFWRLEDTAPEVFWGYWARHIWHIRYEQLALAPYRALYEILAGRQYFICSTNCDGQLVKAGFPAERIFAPQGEYAYFQCSTPCGDDLTPNRALIEGMMAHMPDRFTIAAEDVPRCPRCGALLMPNLRCDSRFVEAPHLANHPAYQRFLAEGAGQRTVFLELGVGFNTPGIIRLPFERMAAGREGAALVRVNLQDAGLSTGLAPDRAVLLQADVAEVLEALRAG